LHPVMPFVTQEIWAALPGTPGEDLALTPYPAWRPEARDAAVETEMALLQEAIVAIRNIRGELNIAPSVSLTAIFRTAEPAHAETLTTYASLVRLLAKVGEVTVGASVQAPKAAATAVVQGVELFVPLAGAVDFEAELVVVIGKKAKNVPAGKAGEYILGYTCGNDVTARDLQPKDGQWTLAKSFDTFLPFGPWIETDLDPSALGIRAILNGEVKQASSTANLIFPVIELVSYLSSVMTLEPGDIIMTGTPSGVGPMKSGDEIVVEIEGIGRLVNRVR